MARFAIVSREQLGQKKWLRFTDYGFAAAEALAPIVGNELASAALAMPLAFFLEPSGAYTLVAVLSPIPGRNMFVGPGGRWLGAYVPAWFRARPFGMSPQQGADKVALCVDEESGLVVEPSAAGAAGEDFFDAEGNPSEALKPIFKFLLEIERSRRVTDLAVAALAQAGVIQPWHIKIKTEQTEQATSGLHRIDEAALRALPDDVFLKLRKASALPIAYAQLLSAWQLPMFEYLEKAHNQAAPPRVPALPESVDSLFEMPKDDMIRFD